MIRLRTSTLEAFRRVVATDYGREDELCDTIRRGQWVDGPANWQMEAGTAWHHCLAGTISDARDGRLFSGAYCFDSAAVDAADRHRGPGLYEVTGRRALLDLGVELEGTADHVHGLALRDAKSKFSAVDARDYERSLQWRVYSLIFGAAVFVYDLFDFNDPKDGYCQLRDIVSFRFWPYPGMEAEVRGWVREFLAWAGDRGLMAYLRGTT